VNYYQRLLVCNVILLQLRLCCCDVIDNISRLIGSQQDFLNVYPSSEIYWLPQSVFISWHELFTMSIVTLAVVRDIIVLYCNTKITPLCLFVELV